MSPALLPSHSRRSCTLALLLRTGRFSCNQSAPQDHRSSCKSQWSSFSLFLLRSCATVRKHTVYTCTTSKLAFSLCIKPKHTSCMQRDASHVQCRPAYADVQQAADVLLQYNFTYFFDINATASNAKWLRSAVMFYERDASGEDVWGAGTAIPVPWDTEGSVTRGMFCFRVACYRMLLSNSARSNAGFLETERTKSSSYLGTMPCPQRTSNSGVRKRCMTSSP
jgi:hypothetical protein